MAILIFLLQLGALLALARLLGAALRRIGQPAVIGELLAGIILGPSLLGHFAPALHSQLFPQSGARALEFVAWLGMVSLMLLTGLETDVRAVRSLGRAALLASIFGMVIPFASGLLLGLTLPDQYLTNPADRSLFAAFMATAMAISAMPVIAKILIDLDMLHRDVGMIILSAAVLDDTTGWIVLSVISAMAGGRGFSAGALLATLAALALFVATARWLAFPLLSRSISWINSKVKNPGGELVIIVIAAFAGAAATEAIGIHAVFGAFVAGLVVRQIPAVRVASLDQLERLVLAAFAPVFFALVGLRVDLWAMHGWRIPLLVIGVAVACKIVGCYIGGRLGRLTQWESLALGFGMNARGAMGLIVALLGLSLGLLTQEMYSTIVLVAVVTSFMAPILLRWALPKIPLREDERRRMAAEKLRHQVQPGRE